MAEVANEPILRVSNLYKSFSGIVAANDISVSVAPAEIVGIIGANGAGKTVFINMITGYLKPTSGKIEYSGKDITGIKPRDAVHIGICRSFQTSQVFMTMTVRQNLAIALAIARENGKAMMCPIDNLELGEECRQIMEAYKIIKYADCEAGTLSQGVGKLLDIVMAVVSGPKVLLLDEPTSGISSEEKFAAMNIVMGALKKMGAAVFLVEHDMEIVERYADRVLAFYQGKVICDAPPAEALRDKKVIEFVTGTQWRPNGNAR